MGLFDVDVYWPLEAKVIENRGMTCYLFGLSVCDVMYRFLSRFFQMISDRVCHSFFPANVVTRIIWQQCGLFVVVVPLVSQVRLSRPRLSVCMWQERRSFSHISHKEVISKGPNRNKKKRKKELTGNEKWFPGFPYLFKRPVSTHTKRDSHSDYIGVKQFSFLFFFCVSHLFSVGEEEATDHFSRNGD